jgi:hypothetical protein
MKNPQLTEYGRRLREALDLAAVAQSNALDRAIASGQIVCEVRDYLRENPTILQTFAHWFRSTCKGYKARTASTHAIVYKQVTANSQKSYSSIQEVLKDWRKTHPKRPRFVPPTQEEYDKEMKELDRRELLDNAAKPVLPPHERIRLGDIEDWLGDRQIFLINDPDVIDVISKNPKVAELINLLLSDQKNV